MRCLLTLMIVLLSVSLSLAVPPLVSYQGVLTDPNDNDKPVRNQTLSVIFTVYDAPTAGNSKWTETTSITTDNIGQFHVLLGSVESIPDTVFDGNDRWLGIQVESDPEMTPRTRLVSVPYAFRGLWANNAGSAQNADMLGGLSAEAFADTGHIHAVPDTVEFARNCDTAQVALNFPEDGTVSQLKLKTATGEVSTSINCNMTLPGGEFGFYPQIRQSGHDGITIWRIAHDFHMTSYVTNIFLDVSGGGGTSYARQRYVTSSGTDHWVFLLVARRDYAQTDSQGVTHAVKKGTMLAGYQAPDHPCTNQGGADETDIPHPFDRFDSERHEIILIDNEILPKVKSEVTSRRSLLTVINEDYEVDFSDKPVYQAREIVEIDEYGDKRGEIVKKMKTPEWAKLLIGKDEIYLKRRLVQTLPPCISYKKLRPRTSTIPEYVLK